MKELLDQKYDDLILRIINGSYGHSDLPLVKNIFTILDKDRQDELINKVIDYTELHFAYSILCLTHDKDECLSILIDKRLNDKKSTGKDNYKAHRLFSLFI